MKGVDPTANPVDIRGKPGCQLGSPTPCWDMKGADPTANPDDIRGRPGCRLGSPTLIGDSESWEYVAAGLCPRQADVRVEGRRGKPDCHSIPPTGSKEGK